MLRVNNQITVFPLIRAGPQALPSNKRRTLKYGLLEVINLTINRN